jgi:hypothetical protein
MHEIFSKIVFAAEHSRWKFSSSVVREKIRQIVPQTGLQEVRIAVVQPLDRANTFSRLHSGIATIDPLLDITVRFFGYRNSGGDDEPSPQQYGDRDDAGDGCSLGICHGHVLLSEWIWISSSSIVASWKRDQNRRQIILLETVDAAIEG